VNPMLEPPVDRVRISQAGKDQLIKLKRVTGISQWNILCRWAFCLSLSESATPSPVSIPTDSNIEMTWQTFGGEIADLLIIVFKQRCCKDKLLLEQDVLANQFRLHLHRGIGYLSADANLKTIKVLISLKESLNKRKWTVSYMTNYGNGQIAEWAGSKSFWIGQ
jgi:DNA sulfur modification protein DndE